MNKSNNNNNSLFGVVYEYLSGLSQICMMSAS